MLTIAGFQHASSSPSTMDDSQLGHHQIQIWEATYIDTPLIRGFTWHASKTCDFWLENQPHALHLGYIYVYLPTVG